MPTRTKRTTATSKAGLATWIIGLILAAVVPALASPQDSVDRLGHQVERVESEVASWGDSIPTAELKLRLMRHVRFLHHVAHERGANQEMMRRIEDLEFLIRTGQSNVPEQPAASVKSLDKSGSIIGKVTRASDGSPLANIDVYLLDASGFLFVGQSTGSAGNYTFQDVDPGEYRLLTENSAGYLDELFNNIPCPGGQYRCDLADGTPVFVVDGGVANADFELEVGGSISGKITWSETAEPPLFIDVSLFQTNDTSLERILVGSSGTFRFSGLEAGTYYVSTFNFDGFGDVLYDDIPCPGGAGTGCEPTSGTPISVARGVETSGIDFHLEQGGRISGRIIDGLTGEPIEYVSLGTYDLQGNPVGSGSTDREGRYAIGGLETATYFVSTFNTRGFEDELFDDLPCPSGACDPTVGAPIDVQINQTTEGIDFVLEGGCLESETVMCLNLDRFRVEAEWRTSVGETGVGQVEELTSDSGYLWFFGPNNIEMVVKVLDACTLPGANKFWVFAGGLTDVEVTLTITDTDNGTVRTYVNPLGTPFQPIQDTSAFDTCP